MTLTLTFDLLNPSVDFSISLSHPSYGFSFVSCWR